MKWKRTAMSLALAGCMMATTVPVTAFAANGTETTMAAEQKDTAPAKVDSFYVKGDTSVAKGKTITLNAYASSTGSYDPANVTWEIDETKTKGEATIAGPQGAAAESVTGGSVVVTGVNTGAVVLKATYAKGTANEAVAEYTVTVEELAATAKITLDKTSIDLTLKDGKASDTLAVKRLTADGKAANDKLAYSLKWVNGSTASDTVPSGISIDAEGNVTATAAGTYVVYAEATTEANAETGAVATLIKSEECTITVKETATLGTVTIKNANKLTPSVFAVQAGEELPLTVSVGDFKGDYSVAWSVVDAGSKYASIDAKTGKLTAASDLSDLKTDSTTVTVRATVTSGSTSKVVEQAITINKVRIPLEGIKISANSASVTVNKTVELSVTPIPENATIDPKTDIAWSTADDTYLTQAYEKDEDGKDITTKPIAGSYVGKSAGDVYVYVTVNGYDTEDGEVTTDKSASYTKSCKVTVVSADVEQIKDFAVKDITGLAVGTSVKLDSSKLDSIDPQNVTIKPEEITWKVADTSVAEIVNGYLMPKAANETTLYATVNGITRSKKIVVTDASDVAEKVSIKFASPSVALVEGTKDAAVNTLTVKPDSLANSVTGVVYTSNNEKVATVDAATGKVTAKSAGTATITANVAGKTASYVVTVVSKDPVVPTGFVDVPANAWYADAVNTAAAKGLMNGTGNNKFEPLKTVQRSQVAAIVWNIEGAPAVTGTTPFTDVAADAWYAQAVTWAYQNKVVSGTSATTFAPNQNITRQDFAVVLYNKAGKPAASADLSKFVDASKINSWAQDAVKWAVSKGIINGNDKNELNPTGTLTRAEAASIIVKYVG